MTYSAMIMWSLFPPLKGLASQAKACVFDVLFYVELAFIWLTAPNNHNNAKTGSFACEMIPDRSRNAPISIPITEMPTIK